MERNFIQLIRARWDEGKFVCVGLDSDYDKIPEVIRKQHSSIEDGIFEFNKAIIEATNDLVCAYKPNTAFYEAYGDEGFRALKRTCDFIHEVASTVPIILDAKRGDIGRTNEMYAKFAFDWLQADAITVSPYLGGAALGPFLDRADRGIIILCKTSNPGSGEFQDMAVHVNEESISLFEEIAKNVSRIWNKNGNCALVVGATYPEELRKVRSLAGDMPILIPGIGKQGGDLEKSILFGRDSKKQGIIINSSSGIIFASNNSDFAEAARQETLRLHEAIKKQV